MEKKKKEPKKDKSYIENGESLVNMNKDELIQEISRYRKEINRLESTTVDLAKLYSVEQAEKAKAKHGLVLLEESSLELASALGDINLDRERAESEKDMLEKSAMELLTIIGEMSLEKKEAEDARDILEKSSMEIATALGETSLEKHESEKSFDRLKNVSLKLTDTLTKVSSEKQLAEKQRNRLAELSIQLKNMDKSISSLLNKIIPAQIKREFISGKVDFSAHDISLLYIKIQDYPNISTISKPIGLAKDTKSFFTELHKIIIYFNGWLIKYIGNSIMVMFGVPYYTKTHHLDAALCAYKIIQFTKKTSFKVHIGIHSGSAIIGDVGSPWRPQYDCMGEAVEWAIRLEDSSSDLHTKIIISEPTADKIKYFFHLEKFKNIHLPKIGYRTVYGLKNIYPILENHYRIPPNSVIALKYGHLVKKIEEKRKKYFYDIDITKIELKDGSIGQSQAIAFYSLALKETLQIDVDEDNIIKAAFLMNSGKLSVKRSVLTKSKLDDSEKEFIKNLYDLSCSIIDSIGKYSEVKDIIMELSKPFEKITLNEARLLKIASVFEGISFPKLYKECSFDIEAAKKMLLKTIKGEWTEKFLSLFDLSC
ncbi:adenylate/guanylate cyclase domain-containing protein [Spirochaetota bacterium]